LAFAVARKDAIGNGSLKLPVIGWVKFRQSREIADGATIKQVRIVKRASGFYAMLTLQWDVIIPDAMPTVNRLKSM
jgi:putative transposase